MWSKCYMPKSLITILSKVHISLCSSLGSWVWIHLKMRYLPVFFCVIMRAHALQLSDTQSRASSWQHMPCNRLILNLGNPYDSTWLATVWYSIPGILMTAHALQLSDTQSRESSRQHMPFNFLILNPGNASNKLINLHVCDSITVLRRQTYLMRWQKKPNTYVISVSIWNLKISIMQMALT
jgi:hypothetical protein